MNTRSLDDARLSLFEIFQITLKTAKKFYSKTAYYEYIENDIIRLRREIIFPTYESLNALKQHLDAFKHSVDLCTNETKMLPIFKYVNAYIDTVNDKINHLSKQNPHSVKPNVTRTKTLQVVISPALKESIKRSLTTTNLKANLDAFNKKPSSKSNSPSTIIMDKNALSNEAKLKDETIELSSDANQVIINLRRYANSLQEEIESFCCLTFFVGNTNKQYKMEKLREMANQIEKGMSYQNVIQQGLLDKNLISGRFRHNVRNLLTNIFHNKIEDYINNRRKDLRRSAA